MNTIRQAFSQARDHEQERPNITIDFVFLVFADSIIELAIETKDLPLARAIKPHSIISYRPC